MGTIRYLSMDKLLNEQIDLIVIQVRGKGLNCSKVDVVRKLLLKYEKEKLEAKKIKRNEWSF